MDEKTDHVSDPAHADLVLPQVARLLRPLVGLLIRAGITFPAIAELLRELYVQVAEKEFSLPERGQTDSRISLLTGVHRKEVSRLRDASSAPKQASANLSLSSQVIARWTADPRFLNENGRPKLLPRTSVGGGDVSFESLVESVTRDMRPRAVLDNWLDQNIVEIVEPGLLSLREAAFLPKAGEEDQLHYFGRNLHDHMAAAVANVRGEKPAFFERAVHYDALNEETAKLLAAKADEAAMNILLDVNKIALNLSDNEPEGDWRWSLGVYVYREKTPRREEK